MNYAQELLRLIKALNEEQVEYALIGGGALNVHGLVRATQDVDLFVLPEAGNIERLKAALRTIWRDPHIDEISADDLCGPYPAVRYGPPEGSIFLDILTRLGTRFEYSNIDYEVIHVGDVAVRVATPETLFRMKKDTVRDIDRADARALAEAFDLGDIDAD